MSGGRIIAIIVSVLLVLGLFVLIFWPEEEKKPDWFEFYHQSNKEPYGTYALSELQEDFFPEHTHVTLDKALKKSLQPSKIKTPSNYICVSDVVYWSQQDEDTLLAFIKKGNNAFLSLKKLPLSFTQKISDSTQEDMLISFVSDHELSLYLIGEDSAYPVYYYNGEKKSTYWWSGISNGFDKGLNAEELGTYTEKGSDQHYLNFVRVKYGEGYLYLHTMPLAFSNYFITTPSGRAYAEKTLSFLPEGDVYWDNVSQLENDIPDSLQNESRSPLSFILSKRGLKWAWYLILGTLLLYVLFRAKRKQRIIPVIEPNINTSVMFIETIGKLYYMQNNHRKIVLLKMRHFITFIRMRYKLNLLKERGAKIDQLAVIAGVQQKDVAELFALYDRIHLRENITAEELILFNTAIEKFYKNCK
ncbi:MAG: hypothetical protein ACKOXB_06740 [Flavobacteriales bacterium]